jgi:hypothetical protein
MAPKIAYKKTPCKYFASGHCKKGDQCTFIHGTADTSNAGPSTGVGAYDMADLSIATLKGQTAQVSVRLTATVADLLSEIAKALNMGSSQVDGLQLVFKGKELADPHATLRSLGLKAGKQTKYDKIIVANRYDGGVKKNWQSRSAEQEIAVQLPYMHELEGVESCGPDEKDCKLIHLLMRGTEGSPYSGGSFKVGIYHLLKLPPTIAVGGKLQLQPEVHAAPIPDVFVVWQENEAKLCGTH